MYCGSNDAEKYIISLDHKWLVLYSQEAGCEKALSTSDNRDYRQISRMENVKILHKSQNESSAHKKMSFGNVDGVSKPAG